MPCFETPIRNNQLLCDCVISPIKATGTKNKVALVPYRALIDTGATGCCISNKVVKNLKLTSNQTQPTIGVHGKQEAKVYRINIGLFTTSPTTDKKQINVDVKLLQNTLVSEFNSENQNFDAIIGMDYLSACVLIVNNGKFTICY